MLQSEKRIGVPAEAVGSRLDVWLSHCFEDMSRSRIQGLIKAGDVLVDGVPGKANRKLVAGMEVFIRIPCASVSGEPEAEDIPVDFLYRDDDIAVVNKSPGMVMHPAAGHAHGTLVNALLHHCGELPGIAGIQAARGRQAVPCSGLGLTVTAKRKNRHRIREEPDQQEENECAGEDRTSSYYGL